jgi:cyclophilin family peptidyl-prolyl cis-trans isomerase
LIARRAVAASLVTLLATGTVLGTAAAAQEASPRLVGPPAATPLAEPAALPSGDGTGVRLQTALGDIVIGLFTESSPVAAENFLNLVEAGFYDGVGFHRIVPGFVIQGGDPEGTGQGGPGYTIEDEPVVGEYGRGVVAMARTPQPDSQGSQFFIVLDDEARAALDSARTYAIFGRVVEGMEVADAIAAGRSTGPPEDRALDPVIIETAIQEAVVLPPEPSPAPRMDDPELAAQVPATVVGTPLTVQSITGEGIVTGFAPDDPLVLGFQEMANDKGFAMDDLSLVVAGAALPSGMTVDLRGLRVRGADASTLIASFAAVMIGDDDFTGEVVTLGGREVTVLTSDKLTVPVTALASGDVVWLVVTGDEPARDELLAALP